MRIIKAAALLFITFALSEVLIGLLFFLGTVSISVISSTAPMRDYIRNHDSQLRQKIFTQTFADAKKCVEIPDSQTRTDCRSNIGREIGDNLEDDELTTPELRNYGPFQLFFVKQQGNHVESLGWDGELISQNIKPWENLLFDNRVFLVKPFINSCQFFSHEANYLTCEVFEPISVDSNVQGYLGWKVNYDKGPGILMTIVIYTFYLLTAPLFLAYSLGSINNTIAINNSNVLLFIAFIASALAPYLIAGYLTGFYLHKTSPKRRQIH